MDTPAPPGAPDRALEDLIDRLHAGERLRVWSIVITVFGDAIVPRGGVLALGALTGLLARLRIEAGAVRAAVSRLAADQWLERERRGRFSFYRLAAGGYEEFERASRRIYAAGPPDWDGRWTIAVIAQEAGEGRDRHRAALRATGFGDLGPTTFIRPETADASPMPDTKQTIVLSATGAGRADGAALAREAWNLEPLADAYEKMIDAFSPLDHALAKNGALDFLSAMAARTLLVHEFRRAVLKDPMLPAVLLPAHWPGAEARELAARLYRRLNEPSETWLDHCGGWPDGNTPRPDRAFKRRFGGL